MSKFVSIEEASRLTRIPVKRIVSLIVLERVDGWITSGSEGRVDLADLKKEK